MAVISVALVLLAAEQLRTLERVRAKSVIFLFLFGGPSQLETFDPHPRTKIGGEVTAISTSVPTWTSFRSPSICTASCLKGTLICVVF